MVVEGSSDQARTRELVEQLVNERAPFDESLLGGGPWQACPLKHSSYKNACLAPQRSYAIGVQCRSCTRADRCCGKRLPPSGTFSQRVAWDVARTRRAVPLRAALAAGSPQCRAEARSGLICCYRLPTQASQDFDPRERTVVNRGEVLGSACFVTATGTYRPLVTHGAAMMPLLHAALHSASFPKCCRDRNSTLMAPRGAGGVL
jgi:hypothetical protein